MDDWTREVPRFDVGLDNGIVARAGRAKEMAPSAFASGANRARLYLVAAALGQELGPGVRIHCDLAPAEGLWRERHAHDALLEPSGAAPLAELVNPLVITDEGRLKPIPMTSPAASTSRRWTA